MQTYKKTTAVYSFHPTVIHATYLYSDSDLDTQFQLCFDGTVTTSTLTGLPLHTLLDTGCHKTLLSKKIYDQNTKHFQNYYEIPFLEKLYNCRKWTTNICTQDDCITIEDSRPLF